MLYHFKFDNWRDWERGWFVSIEDIEPKYKVPYFKYQRMGGLYRKWNVLANNWYTL